MLSLFGIALILAKIVDAAVTQSMAVTIIGADATIVTSSTLPTVNVEVCGDNSCALS
jgi:hypothetical protein